MAQRYVRVQSATDGQIYYGLLQLGREVRTLDAPPWLKGQPTELELPADSYRILAPCAPSKIVAVGKTMPIMLLKWERRFLRNPYCF